MVRVPVPAVLVRWFISAVALFATAWILPSITIEGGDGFLTALITAAILGLVNAILKPVLEILSCGLIILTLGLFMLIINGFTLWLSGWIAENWLDVGYSIDGFWPAVLGGLIVSIISFFLALVVTGDED
ncbi:MAG: phage holin family protein [Thermomicrobiales bacterium]